MEPVQGNNPFTSVVFDESRCRPQRMTKTHAESLACELVMLGTPQQISKKPILSCLQGTWGQRAGDRQIGHRSLPVVGYHPSR
jgi:hypothetical protein